MEKMVSNLGTGFLQAGYKVDFLLIKARGAHLQHLPQGARIIDLKSWSSATSLFALLRYLRRERPAALLAAKDRAGRTALLARRLAGIPEKVVLRLGMNLSQSLQSKTRLQRALRYYPARWLYPWADGIICVSKGVAEDIAAITRLPVSRMRVVANPVITPDIYQLAAQEPGQEWPSIPDAPRIIAIGRLTRQKGFDVLLQAFARLSSICQCRLLILGEGPQRPQLERQIKELQLQELVRLPGFEPNPYACLARAELCVLSSRFEGSPNVLAEALALGVPVVATDCRSGPGQILDEGRFGTLVPVDDARALARAMAEVLKSPPDRSVLPRAVQDYTLENSTRAYLQEMGLQSRINTDSLKETGC